MGKINPKRRLSSFSKYLTADNFIPHLKIPSEFVKNQADNLSQNVYLVNDIGDPRIVKIEKIGNDHFFTIGWKKFAEDLDLRNGEFLLFKLVEKSRFHFWVYGINGCYKVLSSDEQSTDNDEEPSGNEDDVERDGSGDSKNWKLKLTKDHESQLELPKDLSKDTRISRGKKLELVEEDKGRKWPVYITTRRGKFYMTAGWNEFLVRNKVVVGSAILFDFVEGCSSKIKIKLVKNEKGGELFCTAKRGRGRPPNLNKP